MQRAAFAFALVLTFAASSATASGSKVSSPLALARQAEKLKPGDWVWAGNIAPHGPVLVYATASPEQVKDVQSQLGAAEAGDPLYKLRHSAAHVMATAVLEIFPDAGLAIGPPIEDGFYYDFDLPRSLTPDDLAEIERRMAAHVAAAEPFERAEVSRDEARRLFAGQPFKLDFMGPGSGTFAAIGPVIQELLRRQGVEATYSQPPDAQTRFEKGEYTGMIYGHGGSVRDPYYTLRLYQGATQAVPGAHLVNFPKWTNKQYDDIVDQVFVTPMTDIPKLQDLFHQAMSIWLPELPDVQLTEFYHRIPMNQTYWTGWPSKENPYVNEAFWHLTHQLVLNNLEPTQ